MAYDPYVHYNGSMERECNDIHVFLGSYVHAESVDNPLVICSNGVIGVEKGKVSQWRCQ